jgi:hypothetical protein
MASAGQIMACGRWYPRASSCSTQDCGSVQVWCRIVALGYGTNVEGRACGDVAHADCPFGLLGKKAAGATRDPSAACSQPHAKT